MYFKSTNRSSDNLIILQLGEKLAVTGNNEKRTHGIVRWHGSKEKNGHVFCPRRNVPLDELSASVKVVYLASSKVDQLVVSLVLAEGRRSNIN